MKQAREIINAVKDNKKYIEKITQNENIKS
jgi:hypothetical protein